MGTPLIVFRTPGPSSLTRAKAEARRETIRDKLARKLEEHADEVVTAYPKGVRSDDPHQAYKAAEAWLSRVHGRPTQTIQAGAAEEVTLDMSSEERAQLLRELAEDDPAMAQRLGFRSTA